MRREVAHASAALFDLDGTLVYSKHSILGCLDAFTAREAQRIPRRQFSRVFGIPLKEFLTLYYPDEELPHAVDRFQELYLSDWVSSVKPVPGAALALRRLKEASFPTGIVSANQHRVVQAILEATGLGEFVDAYQGVISQRRDLTSKTDVVAYVLRTFQLRKETSVLIGDTPSDGIAARENGLPFWAVSYGYGESKALDKLRPAHSFSTISAVANQLLNGIS